MLDSDTKRRDTLITVIGVWAIVLGGFTTATGFRVIYDYETLTFLFGNLSYLLISTLLVLAAGIIQLASSVALLCQRHLLQRWITLNCYVFLALILSICVCIPTTTVPYQKLSQRDNEIKLLLQSSSAVNANASESSFVYKLENLPREEDIGSFDDTNSAYTLATNFDVNAQEPQVPNQKQVANNLDELRAEHSLIQFVFLHMRLFYSAMLVNFVFVPISLGVIARYVEIRFRIVHSK